MTPQQKAMDAPLTRREVVEAIREVRDCYCGSGMRDQEMICDAFTRLAEALS